MERAHVKRVTQSPAVDGDCTFISASDAMQVESDETFPEGQLALVTITFEQSNHEYAVFRRFCKVAIAHSIEYSFHAFHQF